MLQVDFWDVGLGDAAVVWIDTVHVIIIDCGPCNSRLPLWLLKHGIQVDLVVLTHNDRDHFGGFLKLISLTGMTIGPYALVPDRSREELKRSWRYLMEKRTRGELGDPIAIAPRREKPQDLLSAADIDVSNSPFSLRLEAIYPNLFDGTNAPDKPNYSCALVVLWAYGKPQVAWPGDLPITVCRQELNRHGINPTFLVGPHHGGPIDLNAVDSGMLRAALSSIGNKESWISVGWHKGYKLPNPDFMESVAKERITLRCSQLTPHCDTAQGRFGPALIPTHDWLGLESPERGISCMGSMRVRFYKDDYKVLFAKEHKKATQQVERPLCNTRALR